MYLDYSQIDDPKHLEAIQKHSVQKLEYFLDCLLAEERIGLETHKILLREVYNYSTAVSIIELLVAEKNHKPQTSGYTGAETD